MPAPEIEQYEDSYLDQMYEDRIVEPEPYSGPADFDDHYEDPDFDEGSYEEDDPYGWDYEPFAEFDG